MGGADKGLQHYGDKPLLAWVLARMQPQVAGLLISANRNREHYAGFGWPVIADLPEHRAEGFAGPLAGLYAGLAHCPTAWLMCVPCDTPNLPDDLVARLAGGWQGNPLALASCCGDSQPTVCLLHKTLLRSLGDFLATGERKVRTWQAQAGAVSVAFDDPHQFANFNTLHALNSASEVES